MVVQPPGTQLQLMYLRARLKRLAPGRFVEIGPGSGEVTGLLLRLGWSGSAYDLDATTVTALNERFRDDVARGQLVLIQDDFLTAPAPAGNVDLIISCMVMEHLEDRQISLYMERAACRLNADGLMIGLVPASPAHWGIEDDIAGHCRRYTRTALRDLMEHTGWTLVHDAGLTFPLSNMLLPISNYLVRGSEGHKRDLPPLERTRLSGRRHVAFKTHFPLFAGILLNRVTLAPFHYVQKLFAGSDRALVLYFEAAVKGRAPAP